MTQKNNWVYILYILALLLGISLPNIFLGIELDSSQYSDSLNGFVPALSLIGGVFKWYGNKHIGLKDWVENSKGGIFSLVFVTCFLSALFSGIVAISEISDSLKIMFLGICSIFGLYLLFRGGHDNH